MATARSSAAQALRQSGLIPREDLERAERLARDKRIGLERATLALGLVSEDQIVHLVAQKQGLDLVFPSGSGVDADLVARFPSELLRRHGAVPLLVEEGQAIVAFAEPPSAEVLDEFARACDLPIRPVLASSRRLRSTLAQVLPPNGAEGTEAPAGAASSPRSASGGAFDRHMNAAFAAGADEVRFEPTKSRLRVRVRKGGALVDRATEPSGVGAAVAARARRLADLPASSGPQTAECRARIAGQEVPLHVAIVPSTTGDLVVLSRRRDLPARVALDECGLSADVLQWLCGPFSAPTSGADIASGLVLVAAAEAGLLHAFVGSVLDGMDPATAVVAVTAQAGFEAEGRVQVVPVGDDVSAAIHAVRATRPDVLFVDGGETARGAAEAAQAAAEGVRVLYGMVDPHPGDAIVALLHAEASLSRPQRSLCGVFLVDRCRALCPRCSRPDPAPETGSEESEDMPEREEGARIPVGCEECSGLGFDGTEIVVAGARVDADVRARIIQGLPLLAPAFVQRLVARFRAVVTLGRISRADAEARIAALERR